MRKQRYFIFSFIVILLSNLIFGINGITFVPAKEVSSVKSIDKKIVLENSGSAVSDGKYIYYSYQGDGKRMDIIKLDPKTLKSKSIAKHTGNGFTNLSIKGNYIYAVWDKANGYGVGNEEPYIYRISKDGKKKKMLAAGENPIIVGDKIYYYSGKIVKFKNEIEEERNLNDFESDGYISSMDLDGKNQKQIIKIDSKANRWRKLFKSGEKVYYENNKNQICDLSGKVIKESKLINTGEMCFWGFGAHETYDTKTKLKYRKTDEFGADKLQVGNYKAGKWKYKMLAQFYMLQNISVFNDYIIVKVWESSDEEHQLCKIYLLDKNGKKLKELHSWIPAE